MSSSTSSPGDLLDIMEHPNPDRYAGQRIFVVRREDYADLVPFVEDEHTVGELTADSLAESYPEEAYEWMSPRAESGYQMWYGAWRAPFDPKAARMRSAVTLDSKLIRKGSNVPGGR